MTPPSEKRAYLTHVYSGPARPFVLGGGLDYSVEAEQISGAFHTEDFQDGAGVLLSNGENPEKRWVVARRDIPKVRFVP